jgi:hypothetical protein
LDRLRSLNPDFAEELQNSGKYSWILGAAMN